MKTYSSREIIQLLQETGWVLKNISGDHHHFIHPDKKGKVTVPHPKKDLKKYELQSIAKQSGLSL